MKGGWCKVERRHLLIGNFDPLGITTFVQGGLDPQTRLRRGVGDQIDNDCMTRQRLATPVLCDPAKHPVLDLVPLARPWGKVTDRDLEAGLVGELLQRLLPQPIAARVTATPIGSDQEFTRGGILILSSQASQHVPAAIHLRPIFVRFASWQRCHEP